MTIPGGLTRGSDVGAGFNITENGKNTNIAELKAAKAARVAARLAGTKDSARSRAVASPYENPAGGIPRVVPPVGGAG